MKKIHLYTFCLAALSFTGCKKYLDKEPDNRTQIVTAEQLSQLLTNAYPHGNYMLFCESMSDNAEDKNQGGSGYDFIDRINRQAFRYEVVQSTPDDNDSPDFYWNSCYKAIASANLALQKIDQSPNKAQLTAQRGEALLARAYSHFMLVTFFAKAYDPATAASDPGIPYVTAPENIVLAKYERKTVAYVYEMLEKDLKEGYPLIDEKIYGTAPKFHFNRQAAAAFAARFYMFKRDYGSVVTYSAQALTGNAADNLKPWNTTFVNLEYYDQQSEYARSTTRGNLLLAETNSFWGKAYPSIRFGLGNNVFTQLFLSSTVAGVRYSYNLYGQPEVYNIPKFFTFSVKESLNSTTGDPYVTIPLFSAEEVVLNRAEAYTRLNNKVAAIADLNAFISQNMLNYNPATANVTTKKIVDYYNMPTDTAGAMIRASLDFKKATFIHEGMRWFDILRLKIPVNHQMASGELITLTADDKRRALQLPILTKQAGLEQNVR